MKELCISREQLMGIHVVVDGQGFELLYRAISNTVSHLEVLWYGRINTAKQKDGLTSFVVLNVLDAKIFQYGFLQEQKVCEYNRY